MNNHAPGYDLSDHERDTTAHRAALDAERELLAEAVAEYEEEEARRNHDARQRTEAFALTVRGAIMGHPRGDVLLRMLEFESLHARALITAAGETWAIGPETDPPGQRYRIELLGHTGLDGYGASRRFVELGSLAAVLLRLIGERATHKAANETGAQAWERSGATGRAAG